LFAVGRIRGPAIKQGDAMGKRQRLAARDVGAFFGTSLAPLSMDLLVPRTGGTASGVGSEATPDRSGPDDSWRPVNDGTDPDTRTGEDAASS
jgi:hypothetical protein